MTAAYPGQARHAQVVHALGAAIVRGELGPGRPVPTEDELVGRFEVGRSALREGVKVLAGKGLLESRTSADGARYMVADWDTCARSVIWKT